VALTAQRSLAVDRSYIPLGVPIWLDAAQRYTTGAIRRLVVSQDTGGAVKGPVRGDLFWGSGDAAAAAAGSMNARGHYYLLLPRTIATAAIRSADAH
jgi:membrane-bound lytic murein transglycosylase A